MGGRDFLSIDDVTEHELLALLDAADEAKRRPSAFASSARGRAVALIFEKPSTRTRVSFELAVAQMGGQAVVLRGQDLQAARGETLADTARVLSRYVDAIAMRTFGQERLAEIATAAEIPVISLLTDHEHPCQAVADLQTIREHRGRLEGVVLAYLGDGNNVAHSLLLAGARTGVEVRIAAPRGYEPDPSVVTRAADLYAPRGYLPLVTGDVLEAATGADVLYTDVWTSMGQEDESEMRALAFEGYRIDEAAVAAASPDVMVMHPLPAHRGAEITDDIMDGPRSVVWDQAENRLHVQKAILAWALTDGPSS